MTCPGRRMAGAARSGQLAAFKRFQRITLKGCKTYKDWIKKLMEFQFRKPEGYADPISLSRQKKWNPIITAYMEGQG